MQKCNICQTKSSSSKRKKFVIYLVIFISVVFSRVFCINHEIANHPDEGVFVYSSVSIANKMIHPESEYSEIKPYPQGSYFFYAPFQILEKVICRLIGPFLHSAYFMNRLGAVIYFALGAVIGFDILLRFIKSTKSAGVFIILIVFSIFHIEQSHYGTGDALSFFLLMLCIHSACAYLETFKIRYTMLSSLLVGMMGAVKYPLVYFLFIPLSTLLIARKRNPKLFGAKFLSCIVCVMLGFFIFSPGPLNDLSYISQVSQRELNAYVYTGNTSEIGGVSNHVLFTFAFWFLYSDLLLAPIFFCIGIWAIVKNKTKHTNELSLFLTYVVPIGALVFLTYNMFVTTLFMRTLYPFFGISLLYTAHGIEYISKYIRPRRVVAVLLLLTVLRGMWLMKAYFPQDSREHLADLLEQATIVSGGKHTVVLASDVYVEDRNDELTPYLTNAEKVTKQILTEQGFPVSRPGEVILTGALEFGVAQDYLIRLKSEEMNRLIDGWENYKEDNRPYYIGQSYPQYYGYLFGFWIKGSNLCKYDFPMNYVYAIPN